VPDVRTFAVLSPFVGGDYYGAVIAGVNRAAVAAGDRVIAMQTLDPGSHSADYGMPDFRQPIAWRYLDGVVAMPGAVSPGYAQALRDIGVPVVLIGHELPGVQCPVVLADNRAGVGDAVRHLVRHGYDADRLRREPGRLRRSGTSRGVPGGTRGLRHRPGPGPADRRARQPRVRRAAIAEALIAAGMPATAIVLGTDRNALGWSRH
jgi:DNA-binding LacI/PurR family transcriptional regulator